jgi:hypothetical protein
VPDQIAIRQSWLNNSPPVEDFSRSPRFHRRKQSKANMTAVAEHQPFWWVAGLHRMADYRGSLPAAQNQKLLYATVLRSALKIIWVSAN